jgi:hypothetical protein
MNSSLTTLKALQFLALAASLGALAVVIATAFQQYPAPLFGCASAGSVLLIMARDYAPRRRRWEPRTDRVPAGRSHTTQGCPLAA